jgi:SAM-dependent methyltransferase
MEMAREFLRSRVILTAHELGIFGLLDAGPKPSGAIAGALGTDSRATDRLLNALCAIGLAEKDGGLFRNSEVASHCLVPGSPGYLGGLGHTVKMWESWGTLTECVRRGSSVPGDQMKERGEEWFKPFIEAMHANASAKAAEVVSLLDLAGVGRVLDVGGGSGAYAMEFARRDDGIRATVFDLPPVVPLARGYIGQAGMGERVDAVAGDFLGDDFGGGFDLVFVSAIIHMLSPAENRQLIGKCVGALAPGGQVVIQDFIMEDNRVQPPNGAMFALNMLVATRAGDTYTEQEVAGWMREAGLADVKRVDTKAGTSLMAGRLSG